ncbi:hypothetical protein C8Q77DRAFT_922881 [Trametes polyzona]|nr:hypothetical protein C8Q77DRAFT_922881 [Trametes polyzona]
MIVRPTVSSQFNTRRSQSTPPRRRSNSAGAAAAAEAASALPAGAHLLVQALHSSSKHDPDPLLKGHLAKRKLFRLKRPSSSYLEKRPLLGDHHPVPSPTSPTAPPRPPRNPARVNSRPSTSSGSTEQPAAHGPSQSTHAIADSREQHPPSGDAAEWELPLPRGSEFPLQRKKSKSSRYDSSRTIQDENAQNDLPFSTLDRAILEELRQKIRAREGQFVIRSGRKYHAFSAEDVPYPRSYDRQVVDMDVWDNLWQHQMGGSVTMHVFETPPARVLELGCGTGTWILNAAREWKNSHFVGLDVVPLHPDLVQVGSFDLASRITWVQANFCRLTYRFPSLERLPFPNEEFDYVRVVRVARGVPEDKWDGLLEEITRVMKPGGAFEMWEEDLRFPGGRPETVSIIETPEPKHVDESPPTPPHTDSSHSSEQEKVLPPHTYILPSHRSLAFSYSFDDVFKVKRDMLDETVRPLRPLPSNIDVSSTPMLLRKVERPPVDPHDHSLLETIYDEMHAARFINLEPVSLLANLLPLHLRDVRAPPPIVVNFPPAPSSSGTPSAPFAVKNVPVIGESRSEDHKHARMSTESLPSGILHSRDLASGTPFVALDISRYSGFSPAALRRSLPSPSPASPQSGPHPSSTPTASRPDVLKSMNPLPNKTINFDPRSINLLLTLRVQEVLACAEPMWDWVVDFQESTARSRATVTSRATSDLLTLKSSRHRRHPKEDELMNLTRLQFDELLRRFELDMKYRMYLAAATEDRLEWAPYAPSTSEEREVFEAMCAAWADYERRVSPGSSSPARGFSSSGSPLPSQSDLEGGSSHSSADLLSRSSRSAGDADGSAGRVGEPLQACGTATPTRTQSGFAGPPRHSEQDPPPSSRTGRIFVAWKA